MGYGINRFVSTVDQNIVCTICAGVMEQAVITLCGHTFCHQCLSTWLDRPDTISCPACRAYTSKFEMIPNLLVRNIIDSLLVYCDHSEEGCKIVMKLESLPHHLEICEYREVFCPACSTSVRKVNLPEHLYSCAAIEKELNKSKLPREPSQLTIEMLTKQITALELDITRTQDALKKSQTHACKVEKDLFDLKRQWETRNDTIDRSCPELDTDYAYGYSPSSIAQLSLLISRYLLEKPSRIDRNRIFTAIKRCFTYYHSYAGYSQDVHMLLATAYASNWFPEHQRWTLERWLQQIAVTKFTERGGEDPSYEF